MVRALARCSTQLLDASSRVQRTSASRTFSEATDTFGDFTPYFPKRVVITGIGLVTPLAVGAQRTWTQLVAGNTGVRRLEAADLPEAHRPALAQLPSQVAACVPKAELHASAHYLEEDPWRETPVILYALCAAEEALTDAGWRPSTDEEQQQCGVSIGSGMSSALEMANAGKLVMEGKLRRVSPYFVPRILTNMAAGAVSIRYGLRGPLLCASTACASGVHAVGDAFRALQRGEATAMLAGASESCIDAVSLGGFCRLRALSTSFNDDPPAASRPFDARRDGFVMGEGAAVLLLEELQAARARGATAYAEVRGYGTSGDGHHITAPHPGGRGAAEVMRRALAGSGVQKGQVGYVNAHATSTPLGDALEQRAIAEVFGGAAAHAGSAGAPPLLVSSTKGGTGHLLGAAGALEAAFTALALHSRVVPPTVNLQQPDPPGLLAGLVGRGGGAVLPGGPLAALCNAFGFGGTNACLLLTSPPPPLARH